MAENLAFQDWKLTQLSCLCFLIKLNIRYIAEYRITKYSVANKQLPNIRFRTNIRWFQAAERSFSVLVNHCSIPYQWRPRWTRTHAAYHLKSNHFWPPSQSLSLARRRVAAKVAWWQGPRRVEVYKDVWNFKIIPVCRIKIPDTYYCQWFQLLLIDFAET